MKLADIAWLFVALLVAAIPAMAQVPMGNPANGPTKIADAELDPARTMASSELESKLHEPLPEQYIWTAGPMGPGRDRGNLAPRYFRRVFQISSVPAHATLYLAGPSKTMIYVNGKEVGHYQLVPDGHMGIRVYECDVTSELHPGKNVLAIEAVRGPGAGNEAGDNVSRHMQQGDVLAAMIVPAARGIEATPVVMSDSHWKAMKRTAPQGWQDASFNDGSWPAAEDLGGIESSIDLFQANADAGMYAWPGYDGISPFLAQYSLDAMKVKNVSGGVGMVKNPLAITGENAAGPFTVTLPMEHVSFGSSPSVMLDFGREVNGRLELQSNSDAPAEVTVQYGESEMEAVNQPYLGIDPVYIPPHVTAYGPKSAFRYAIVRFVGGRDTQFKAIRLDGIAYPVKYQGSFESSDPELNKMWTIGAYTAHLCMQDDIWDAPKRDRNRWMGDLDVSGRTIDDVFGDHFLMQDTLSRLIGPAPVKHHVNGIPGYSAFWVTGEKMYYLHTGSMKQLESVHTRLVQLLNYMETDLNQQNLFSDLTHAWPFVDWSPEMNSYNAQTRMAMQFEYYAAFKDGEYLLRVMHDDKNAQKLEEKAEELKAAAQEYMLDAKGSFGDRWQPNAYAVISGIANKDQYTKIWRNSLSDVGQVKYNPYIITPYYNFYVVTAMAKMGHRRAALNWIRQYWGGMVQEGATSFWEGYDPNWYKGSNFHASLQADNVSGYYVSLAHGWSSGVTSWLMTQILGIQPTAGGFATVKIRPDLLGLKWAKGGEPTPHGVLHVSIRNDHGYVTKIQLPPDVKASVSVPVPVASAKVLVNGKPMASTPAEGGKRAVVMLSGQGSYTVSTKWP
jgi:hypothetical protein